MSGCSSLYNALLELFSEKGGDIARLRNWSGTGLRTSWRQDAMRNQVRKRLPYVRAALRREPRLASARCNNGASPIHIACFLGDAELVTILLSSGADAAAPPVSGRSPLEEAMYNGYGEVVTVLLQALPAQKQADARMAVASYMALPGAALRPESLRGLKLPHVERQPVRVDRVSASPEAPDCTTSGDWNAFESTSNEPSDIDQRVALSAQEWYHDYFLKGRPVLIRQVVSLTERCALAASRASMRAAATQRFKCGATAYPELTGRSVCGTFTFLELRDSPRCDDAHHTRPVCNWKLGVVRGSQPTSADDDGVNHTAGFNLMPVSLRHAKTISPMGFMQRAWNVTTSRAIWGGVEGSGSGFHYHNNAYNLLFFGTKEWMLTPTRYSGLSDLDSSEWPDSDSARALPAGLPLRFRQRAGDLVLVPSQWGHSTLSSGGFTIGLGVLWCDQHWMTLSSGKCHTSSIWRSPRRRQKRRTRFDPDPSAGF